MMIILKDRKKMMIEQRSNSNLIKCNKMRSNSKQIKRIEEIIIHHLVIPLREIPIKNQSRNKTNHQHLNRYYKLNSLINKNNKKGMMTAMAQRITNRITSSKLRELITINHLLASTLYKVAINNNKYNNKNKNKDKTDLLIIPIATHSTSTHSLISRKDIT